jgi:hypothetical protein
MKKRQPVGNERNKLDLEKELIAAFERITARDHPNPVASVVRRRPS